jgi:hypothetical protein
VSDEGGLSGLSGISGETSVPVEEEDGPSLDFTDSSNSFYVTMV